LIVNAHKPENWFFSTGFKIAANIDTFSLKKKLFFRVFWSVFGSDVLDKKNGLS